MSDLPRSARRVRDALLGLGLPADIVRLADSTRTALEAAVAVGCELRAIVKSLVMRGAGSGAPALVLVSGSNRADEALLAAALGEPVERPDAAYVREVTGYSIGGIPPVGHPAPLRTLLDGANIKHFLLDANLTDRTQSEAVIHRCCVWA